MIIRISQMYMFGRLYATKKSFSEEGAAILTWDPSANVMNSCTQEAVNALGKLTTSA